MQLYTEMQLVCPVPYSRIGLRSKLVLTIFSKETTRLELNDETLIWRELLEYQNDTCS